MTMGDHIRTMSNKELSKLISDLFFKIPESTQEEKEEFRMRMEEVLGEEED